MISSNLKYNQLLLPKLVNLGLSHQQAEIYLTTLYNPFITVKNLAQNLNKLGPSIHRSIKDLKNIQLIYVYGKNPIKIQAVDPSIALDTLVKQKYQHQIKLKEEIEQEIRGIKLPPQELRVEFLENKNEIFNHALPYINRTNKEILIISIGEPVPQEIFVSLTKAVKRGVNFNLIIEQYNKQNQDLIGNWKKNGWNIKHIKNIELDFTLTIYDQIVAVIQVRKKQDSDNRIGISIYNPGFITAQKNYFYELWGKAKEI